jgi:hypothetical protein
MEMWRNCCDEMVRGPHVSRGVFRLHVFPLTKQTILEEHRRASPLDMPQPRQPRRPRQMLGFDHRFFPMGCWGMITPYHTQYLAI